MGSIMNKQILLLCSIACTLAYASNNGISKAFPTKIASVNTNLLFSDEVGAPEEIRDEIAKIKQEFSERDGRLRKDYDRYAKEMSEFQTSKDKDPKKAEELRKMEANLELERQAAQSFGMRAQQELQYNMGPKIEKAMETVAQQQGWDAITFMPMKVINTKMDVTTDVVAEMNKEYRAQKAAQKFKKGDKKPAASTAA